jgi:hypothetical protein
MRDESDRLGELADLANELLEQATDMRRQWAELAEAIGRDTTLGFDADAPPAQQDTASEQARLVALDMMLSGRSRDETAEHLGRTYPDEDFTRLLDEVFEESK